MNTDTTTAPQTAPATTSPTATEATIARGSNRFYLASAPIWRSLVHLCIPMIAGFSVGVVYNIINAGFIGSLHSTPLLAALTFSLPVFALIMAVGGVFGVGGGTFITRLMGSQEDKETDAAANALRIKQVSSFTMWGAIAAGVVVGVLGLIFSTTIAGLIGASADALAPTATYIGVMFAFAPVYVAAFALEQVVRAEGAAVASMTGLIASTVANLVFDVLFILILPWGVFGAGLALGLSNVVMVGYYVWWLSKKSESVSLAPKFFRADRDMLKTVFGVGASELIMSSFMIVTTLIVNFVAVGYGDALLAGMGVALRVSQLPEMICMGVFTGAIPLIAYAFGARNHARLRKSITGAAIAIGGFTIVFSTLVFLFRDQVFSLFSADPAVLTDGTLILTAMLVSTIFNGFTGLIIAVFQATEQVRNATIMSIAQGVLFIPIILIGNAVIGINGVIWAMTITEGLVFLIGVGLWLASRHAIDRGLGQGSQEQAAEVLEAVAA